MRPPGTCVGASIGGSWRLMNFNYVTYLQILFFAFYNAFAIIRTFFIVFLNPLLNEIH